MRLLARPSWGPRPAPRASGTLPPPAPAASTPSPLTRTRAPVPPRPAPAPAQPNGMARRVLAQAGADVTRLLERTEAFIRKQPKVSGDSVQVRWGSVASSLFNHVRLLTHVARTPLNSRPRPRHAHVHVVCSVIFYSGDSV